MSNNLPVPVTVLNAHCAVLGKTGAGKSSLLRVIVEDLLRRGKRVCVIDPKGDWFGLKLSADGKSPGYPVITFGDFVEEKAADVPINEHSGKHVAELISSGNRPCVIGFRGWMPGKMTQFWIDFASTLFNAKSGELYLVIDECHNFMPKGKVLDPQAGKCLHWSNRIMSEARGLGIVALIASQRPQKVHNDSLTCCETLFAMRVVHSADRSAVEDWIDGCGDPAHGKEVLLSVASLKRGEAFVWSPENNFGPKRVQFQLFSTFDSFAPPQLQKKISAAGWAGVDLDAVKEKLAKVIEEQKANDPAALKKEIQRLKGELAAKPQAAPAAPLPPKEIPAVSDDDMETVKNAATRCEMVKTDLEAHGEHIAELTRELNFIFARLLQIKTGGSVTKFPNPFTLHRNPALNRVAREMRPARVTREQVTNGSLPTGERKILVACAQFEQVPKDDLTVLTGFKRSTRDAYIQRLRERGYVEDGNGVVVPTEDGLIALGDYEPLPTGDALREYWMARLPEGERRILEMLVEAYPDYIDREALEAGTGFKRSTRDAYLQRMKPKRIIEIGNGSTVRAAEMLFG